MGSDDDLYDDPISLRRLLTSPIPSPCPATWGPTGEGSRTTRSATRSAPSGLRVASTDSSTPRRRVPTRSAVTAEASWQVSPLLRRQPLRQLRQGPRHPRLPDRGAEDCREGHARSREEEQEVDVGLLLRSSDGMIMASDLASRERHSTTLLCEQSS